MEIPIKYSLLFFMENEIELGLLRRLSAIAFLFSLFYACVLSEEIFLK